MPRQNRVTPFGDIVALAERGTCMGNRGILHDAAGCIRRQWALNRWIVCVLEFRGRQRQVMAPNRYTELFFLDEATAFAAGHRPCAECRHASFLSFCKAWRSAHPNLAPQHGPIADVIDRRLHEERLTRERKKKTYRALLSELPAGTLVSLSDLPDAFLVTNDGLRKWSPGGYTERIEHPHGDEVAVLTPPSTVAAIRAGYAPGIHPSAG
jgi:hypothetical protein